MSGTSSDTTRMIVNRNVLSTRCLLPQEIIDCIIGFVDPEDRATALSCCLVARSLLAPATKLLFSHLPITKDNHHAVLQQLQTSPLKASAVAQMKFTDFTRRSSLSTISSDVVRAVALAQNLRTLVLHGSHWGRQNHDLLQFASTSLDTLVMSDVLFEDIWDALNLICSFPSLTKLRLDGVYYRTLSHELAQSLKRLLRLPRLVELDVRRTPYAIAPYLFPSNEVGNIATLRVPCRAQSAEVWWRLLHEGDIDPTTFAQLDELSLHDFSTDWRYRSMHMPPTPNLRRIVLKNIVISTRRYTSPCVNILDFLQSLQQTSVDTIVFHFVGFDVMERGIRPLAADPLFMQGFSDLSISATLQRVEYHFQDIRTNVSLIQNEDEIRQLILGAQQNWHGRKTIQIYVK